MTPEDHELKVAKIFINMGADVTFIKPSIGYRAKTADIIMQGVSWEIKSPTGKSKHTISRHIKYAIKQSPNVIIDASRTKLDDENIENRLRKDIEEHRSIKRLKLISKTLRVIDIL